MSCRHGSLRSMDAKFKYASFDRILVLDVRELAAGPCENSFFESDKPCSGSVEPFRNTSHMPREPPQQLLQSPPLPRKGPHCNSSHEVSLDPLLAQNPYSETARHAGAWSQTAGGRHLKEPERLVS